MKEACIRRSHLDARISIVRYLPQSMRQSPHHSLRSDLLRTEGPLECCEVLQVVVPVFIEIETFAALVFNYFVTLYALLKAGVIEKVN